MELIINNFISTHVYHCLCKIRPYTAAVALGPLLYKIENIQRFKRLHAAPLCMGCSGHNMGTGVGTVSLPLVEQQPLIQDVTC